MTKLVLSNHLLEDLAVEEFQNSGGVVDYVPFSVTGEASIEDLHWHAGLKGMQVLVRAINGNAWEAEMTTRPAEARTAPNRPAHLKPDPPVPISIKEFLGPYFDYATQRLIDPWDRSRGGASRRSNGEFITAGYADAFLDPPYKLNISVDRASYLFTMINATMFGGLSDDLDVRRWCTDWSDYFNSGKEWWGAFFWPVYSPALARMCVVGASSTD